MESPLHTFKFTLLMPSVSLLLLLLLLLVLVLLVLVMLVLLSGAGTEGPWMTGRLSGAL